MQIDYRETDFSIFDAPIGLGPVAGQHLLAEGDEAGLKRTHDKTPAVWGKVTQGRSFTPVTSVTEGFLSNYNGVISTRHAVTPV